MLLALGCAVSSGACRDGGELGGREDDLGTCARAIVSADGDGLRLRAAPSTDAPIRDVMPDDSIVDVLDRTPDGAWAKVRFDGTEGWASAQFLACAQLGNVLSATAMTSAQDFNAFSVEGSGFGTGAGRSMKFLIDNRDPQNPKTHFINGNFKVNGAVPESAQNHWPFAVAALGIPEDHLTFNDVAYFTMDKRYIAGSIQTFFPDGAKEPTYAAQFYPDDVIHEELIVSTMRILGRSFKVPGRRAFVRVGSQQTFDRVAGELREIGWEPLTIDQVLGSVDYLPLNPGEAWGRLRLFPKEPELLRPTDIPVFDELPLDLSVVAGTITRQYQDVTSHVNLKSKERGTPNMVLRSAGLDHAVLAKHADAPVHLVVARSGFVVEPTTDAIVEEKLRERLSRPLVGLPVVKEANLFDYDAICPALSPACMTHGNRFGGKASMLGFLANAAVLGRKDQAGSLSQKLGYDISPHGFAVPVQFYRDFLASPDNRVLKDKLDQLITKEKAGQLSPAERLALSKEVKALFYVARVPAAQLEAIKARIAALAASDPQLKDLKVRSSANAEDIPNFDGAGLHDSFELELDHVDNPELSCTLEEDQDGVVTKLKIKPKTAQCTIKAVYASLWNQRAIEERSFARIDQATAAMGLSIVPAYDTESEVAANGVVISRVVNSELRGYTMSTQRGNNLVTNPDPGTIAESAVATFGVVRPIQITTVRFAKPKANEPALAAPVLTDAQMKQAVDIVRRIEQRYCENKEGYFDGDCKTVMQDPFKERALDLEFKLLENGRFVFKQVREFHSR
jgi:hypothetical protein